MVFGIVLAGGSGSRMNTVVPKQFMMLSGKPVIIYSVEKFLNSPEIDRVIIAVPSDDTEYAKELLKKYLGKPVDTVVGGADRNSSLMNVLNFLEREYGMNEDTIVVTHDAARPFVSERIIADNVEAMKKYDACDTCIPASDTIIESFNGKTASAMPDRSRLYQCQTPQTFKALKLKKLYSSLTESEKEKLTDAGKIFFLRKEKVGIVLGDIRNMKLTYSGDIALAEVIAKERKE